MFLYDGQEPRNKSLAISRDVAHSGAIFTKLASSTTHMRLYRLVSLIDYNNVPVNIFTRGFQELPEWDAEGNLVDRSPSSLVLCLLAKLFGDISFQDGAELHYLLCSFLRNAPDIVLTGSTTDAHISISQTHHQEIFTTLRKADRIEILFEILSLIVHGFPEPDTEINPYLDEQYLPIVESTCLPFLETVSFEDIISYCKDKLDNNNNL